VESPGSPRLHDGQTAHAAHAQFARRAILPQVVRLEISDNRNYAPRRSIPTEGRTRRHERGVECGGREGAVLTSGDPSGRRNRMVLAHPRCAKFSQRSKGGSGMTVANAGSPRRVRISRNPSRREGRCDHRRTCGERAFRAIVCAGAPGAAATRSSLHPPLRKEGQRPSKARAKRAARLLAHVLSSVPGCSPARAETRGQPWRHGRACPGHPRCAEHPEGLDGRAYQGKARGMCGVRRAAVETKVAFRAIREPSHHA